MIEKTGEFHIRVVGQNGKIHLSPESYDIKDIKFFLELIEDILYPTDGKDRPLISFDLQEGSVKHVFKTGIQAIIGINAIIGQVFTEGSVDFLDLKTAKAIECIQNLSYEKNYQFELSTSLKQSQKLEITPESHYIRSENILVEAEFYFYGKLTNAGGKTKANIHLDTKELGVLKIDTPKSFLAELEKNFLYKNFGVRATGQQNVETGEIDKNSLKFVELINYTPQYDEKYLASLIKKAKKHWANVDPDKWLRELRGNYV